MPGKRIPADGLTGDLFADLHAPAAPTHPETEVWSSNPSWRALVATALFWLIPSGIVAGLVWALFHSVAGVLSMLAAGLLLAAADALWRAVGLLAVRYRVTTERLFIRRGIFSQQFEQLELSRVDDVRVSQSMLDRLLGIGQVELRGRGSADAILFVLPSIAAPLQVAETVRRQLQRLQRRTALAGSR